ncbi:MAG: 3-phosphoshikimate 1-carboxyvinyltransferase [Oscillibacter sp.]|nr:3-phosphoshikimate 1-carboxyvinyltransferase [Oscillibacter sp.]
MDVTIYPRRLRGTVTPPPSKSMAHRAVIAELLAGLDTVSVSPTLSEDIRATIACAEALRADDESVLDCGESGSTLRFLIPVALALRGGGTFTGRGRLLQRPQTPYFDIFREKGVFYEQAGNRLTVRGRLTPGEYRLPGDVSSQFVTGLLFALPLLDGESVIRLTSPLQSAAYVAMTLDTLRRCGVSVDCGTPDVFRIPGRQRYRVDGLSVEADRSQAAFWCAANFLGNRVKILGLNPKSVQGDRAIVKLFREMANPNPIPIEIDLSGIPDLLPPLAVMAAWGDITRFTHAGRLRYKESDRLESVARLLRAFGVSVKTGPDWMSVNGGIPERNAPLTIDGCRDHRIVMAAAILATVWGAPVTIQGAEAVNKSYPSFFADYQALGGEIRGL